MVIEASDVVFFVPGLPESLKATVGGILSRADVQERLFGEGRGWQAIKSSDD